MFDSLTEKLTRAMKSLRGQAKLTERNIEDALREVRMALLEADVHVQVARTFLQRVKEKALGTEVLQGLNPAQQFIDVVYQELTAIMGGEAPERPLELASKPPTVVMMVGLQGSGKTTTCGKLGEYLEEERTFAPAGARRREPPGGHRAAARGGPGRRGAQFPHRLPGSGGHLPLRPCRRRPRRAGTW